VQDALQAGGCDALIVRLPENIVLLTGHWMHLVGMGGVFVPQTGPATLITLDYEAPEARRAWDGDLRTISYRLTEGSAVEALETRFRELADEHGAVGGRIAYEGSFEAVAPPAIAAEPMAIAAPTIAMMRRACRTDDLCDITEELEAIRAVKLPHELERLRITNEIAIAGLETFRRLALPGITEATLSAQVEAEIQNVGSGYRDARSVRAYACVWSGPATASAWWSYRPENRTIERDDLVLIELATVADGYWSDHTRTVAAGRATGDQRRAVEAVRAAQAVALDQARPQVLAGAVDEAARSSCRQSGFSHFPTPVGHGVGFRYHESRPRLVPGSDEVLAANMVLAVEPGIYEEGLGGFRWEDNGVVTEHGAIRLADTSFEFEL
jgi:Xaa-Pro dipeptidase